MTEIVNKTVSEVIQFTGLDYSVVCTVLLISFGIGIFFGFSRHKSKTIDDFLFGDHKMNSITVAFSLIARYCLKLHRIRVFVRLIFQSTMKTKIEKIIKFKRNFF